MPIWERFWYQRVSRNIGTNATQSSTPVRQSSAKMLMATNTMYMAPEARELMPESSSSRSASRSEVCREMIRPEV